MDGRPINKLWSGEKIKNELEIKNFYSLFISCRPKYFVFSGELHDSWELFYVRKGKASVTADERVYTLDEGCLILHKPFEFHKFEILENDSELFISAFSLEGCFAPLLNNCSLRLKKNEKNLIDNLMDSWSSRSKGIDMVKDSGRHNMREANINDPVFFTFISKSFETLFLSILQYEKNSTLLKEQNGLYKQLVTILEKHVYTGITLKELSEQTGVSEATIRNVFRRQAGCGAHKYLLKIKIREAINLIRQGKTISETSERLGFNNPNYFTIAFKRETGKTPSDYK